MMLEIPRLSADPGEAESFVSGELQTVQDRKNAVLAALSRGLVLRYAAEAGGVSRPLVHEWARTDPTFAQRLADARAAGCEELEHQIQTVADVAAPAVARVKSENLKWLLSKRDPAVYSDRMQLDVHSTVDVAGALSSARERVAQRLSSDPTRALLPQVLDSPGVIEHGDTDSESADEALSRILE